MTSATEFLERRPSWRGDRIVLLYADFDPPAALSAAGITCLPVARTLPAVLRYVPGFDRVKGSMAATLCEPMP